MTEEDKDRIEIPKGRVEILRPEPEDEAPFSGRISYSTGYGSFRIVKLGPVGSLLLVLALGFVLLFGLIFLSGALLFLLPIVALLAAGAVLSGLLSNPFRRLR